MEKSSRWQITQGRQKMMDLQAPSAAPILASATCILHCSCLALPLALLPGLQLSCGHRPQLWCQLLQCPWVTALGRLSSSLPCMVTSSSKRWDAFSICGRGDIHQSPTPPVGGQRDTCPMSRDSHREEMLKPRPFCSASQLIPQTRHFLLLLLPLS